MISWVRWSKPGFSIHCKVTVVSFVINKYLGGRHFETGHFSCFSLNFYPLILAFICGSCPQQCYAIVMVIFYFPHPFYIYGLEFFYKEHLSSLTFFTVINLCWHGLMDIYFILGVIIQYYHYLLCCSSWSSFGHREFSCWLLCPLVCLHLFFFLKCFLTFQYHKMLQPHFLFSLPQPKKEPLLQGALIPFNEGIFIATEVSLLLGLPAGRVRIYLYVN